MVNPLAVLGHAVKASLSNQIRANVPHSSLGGSYGASYGGWSNDPNYSPGPYGVYGSPQQGGFNAQAAAGDIAQNRVVRVCLENIIQAFGQAPPVLEQKQGNNWERVDSHPLIDLLEHPNPNQSGEALWGLLIERLLTVPNGTAYARVVWSKGGQPAQFWFERWVIPRYGTTNFIDSYDLYRESGGKYNLQCAVNVGQGERIDYNRDACIQFQHAANLWNPRYGTTPLNSQMRQIAGDNLTAQRYGAIMRNAPAPSLLVSADPRPGTQPPSPDIFEKLKAALVRNLTGEEAGSVTTLNVRAKVDKLTYSPDELAMPEMMAYFEASICAALRVPKQMTGLQSGDDDRTYANAIEARRQFWDNNIRPFQMARGNEIESQLFPLFGLDKAEYRIEWNRKDVPALQEDETALWQQVAQAFSAGVIDLDQAQVRLGFESKPENQGKFGGGGKPGQEEEAVALDGQRTPPFGATKSYDPGEDRDEAGKWASGGQWGENGEHLKDADEDKVSSVLHQKIENHLSGENVSLKEKQFIGQVKDFIKEDLPSKVANAFVFYNHNLEGEIGAAGKTEGHSVTLGHGAVQNRGSGRTLGGTFLHEVEHLIDEHSGSGRNEYTPRLRQAVRHARADALYYVQKNARMRAESLVEHDMTGYDPTPDEVETAVQEVLKQAKEAYARQDGATKSYDASQSRDESGRWAEGQARAKPGGEVGPNRQWYPGGAFIATTELPKRERDKLVKTASGKEPVDYGRYEIVPAGKLSILSAISDYTNRDGSLNEQSIEYYGQQENHEVIQELSARFQQGERLVNLNEYPQFAKFRDLAKLVLAKAPVAGAVVSKALSTQPPDVAERLRHHLGLQPTAAIKRYDPTEARDDQGHWMAGGSAGKGSRAARNLAPGTAEDAKTRLGITIPKAATNVMLSIDPSADVLATYKELHGRQQTRPVYHPDYERRQAEHKFARIAALHHDLPGLMERADAEAASNGPNAHQALTLRLIAKTGLRNGGDTGKSRVEAFGASNLRTEHARVEGDRVSLDFTGKEGVRQRHAFTDPVLARHIEARKQQGKDTIFDSDSGKTLAYLGKISGGKYKVHDLRTYYGTALAAQRVAHITVREGLPKDAKELRARKLRVGSTVAAHLGNDRDQALSTYVAPAVFEAWDKAVKA